MFKYIAAIEGSHNRDANRFGETRWRFTKFVFSILLAGPFRYGTQNDRK
jgi:hypothetical protein